jgi:tetratricopeptide (TPR) repeat protein
MTRSIVRFLLPAAISILAGAALAQTPAPATLLAQAEELAKEGKFAEAIAAADQALHSEERAFGERDPRLVPALKTLAHFHELQHGYPEAEALYKRALEVEEQELKRLQKLKDKYSRSWLPQTQKQEVLQRNLEFRQGEAAQLKLSILSVAAKRLGEGRLAPAPGPQFRSLRARRVEPVEPAPQAAPHAAPLKPDAGRAVGGEAAADVLPFFPWPPPKPSTTYDFHRTDLARYKTYGEVTSAILSALERTNYVDHRFYQTEARGIALVTKLERISSDGTPAASDRWPEGFGDNPAGFFDFLRGLFLAPAGHYRVIVFMLHDTPIQVSATAPAAEDAARWLEGGVLQLPPEFERRVFGANSVCSALIYEFASDGVKVKGIASAATGKRHLEKTGLLPLE